MIDLLGIFTLWCFHNFDNNKSNNFDGNKRVPIGFFFIFAQINKKKYSIETGTTIQYSNLIFRKNE